MIERIGSLTEFGSQSSTNTSVNVPADATLMLVGVSGFRNQVEFFSGGSMTIDSASMTPVGADALDYYFQGALFYKVLPATGNGKILEWTWLGAVLDGVKFVYGFYKGIDTANPVRDSWGSQASLPPFETDTLNCVSGDLIVAWVEQFYNGGTPVVVWTNAVKIADFLTPYYSAIGSWAEGSPSGNVVVSCDFTADFADGGIMAVVFRAASKIVLVNHTGACGASTAGPIDTTGATLLVAVGHQWNTPGTCTITDNKGNTWYPLTRYGTSGSCGFGQIHYAYGPSLSVGTNHIFYVTAQQYQSLEVLAFSGIGAWAFDLFNSENGNNGVDAYTVQPGSVTPTAIGDLIISTVHDGYSTGTAYTIDSGFIIGHSSYNASDMSGAIAYKVAETVEGHNPTWTHTQSCSKGSEIAVFKAGSGLPTPPLGYEILKSMVPGMALRR